MKAQKLTKETILSLGMRDNQFDNFRVGDCVRVAQRIVEGNKERIQQFEGDIIAMRRHGIATTFTVRKIGASSIAIERIFPLYSPLITAIKVIRRGDVRRAKLYYMRDRIGKMARVAEKVTSHQEQKSA